MLFAEIFEHAKEGAALRSKQPGFIFVDLIVCMFVLTAAASVMSASYGMYFSYRSLLGMRSAVSGLASVHAEAGALPDASGLRCPDGFEVVLERSPSAGPVPLRTLTVRHGTSVAPPISARIWIIRARQ